jgi:hypothetical protein
VSFLVSAALLGLGLVVTVILLPSRRRLAELKAGPAGLGNRETARSPRTRGDRAVPWSAVNVS